MDPRSPTLDQISVFLAVVETGSFTAAAKQLGRATSVISYAIANLEAQLGVSLFARAGTARPKLTDAGRAILSDSRNLAIAVDGLLAKARGLTAGLEAEVSLVVDVMWPAKKLVKALDEFRRKFPTVALRLQVETLGAVTHAVLAGTAAFGVSGPLELARDRLVRGPGGSVKLVPVASPTHPLALMQGVVSAAQAHDHLQLVLTDRSPLTRGRDFGGAGGAQLAAGRPGAPSMPCCWRAPGWCNMPKPMVNDDLKRGRLVELNIEMPGEPVYPFHTVYRNDAPPRPAASWLMERLASS